MRKLLHVLVISILFGVGYAQKQSYAGPTALGPFRIDKDVSMKILFELLGQPSRLSADSFCYQSKSGQTFLVLTRMAESYDGKVAGGALLAGFRNCIDMPVQVTPRELSAWKTEKNIGLGSRVDDVSKAYGNPSREDAIKGTYYRWVIHGDLEDNHYSSQKRPEIGDTVLVYQSAQNELSIAEFGIRDSRVVWVFVSKNE